MERTSDKSPESQESATGLYTGQKWIIENRPQISNINVFHVMRRVFPLL